MLKLPADVPSTSQQQAQAYLGISSPQPDLAIIDIIVRVCSLYHYGCCRALVVSSVVELWGAWCLRSLNLFSLERITRTHQYKLFDSFLSFFRSSTSATVQQ